MYLTTSYLGIEKGALNYLFFLVSEDYIEENARIAAALHPLLERFGRELEHRGAVVRPYDGTASNTFEEVLAAQWEPELTGRFAGKTPALLAIATDFRAFDPRKDPYLFISLRDSMNEYGEVRVFEVQALLEALAKGARSPTLFKDVREALNGAGHRGAFSEIWHTVELKPGIFGISVDLKAAIQALGGRLRGDSGTRFS